VASFFVVGLTGWLRSPTIDHQSPSLQAEPQDKATAQRILAILALGLVLNLIGLVLWLWRTSAPYGRLLYPTLGPLAVLLVFGWQRWLGQRHARRFAWAVILVTGLYALVVPWRYLRPTYASPVTTPSAVEQATALDVQFKNSLFLLGYQMTPERTRPGDEVLLTLYWQTETPLDSDLTVFVQLAPGDPQQRVAGLDELLGSSRYPSRAWQLDEVIKQIHRLRLPEDAPNPALYWFSVGLYSEPEGKRWPGTADGAPLPDAAVRLGPLRVLSRDTPQPQQPVNYRLGPGIRLSGYDVNLITPRPSASTQAGSVDVTLHWLADAAPGEDLTVFVHLLDGNGRLVAQHDGRPRQGEYPTWAWQPGDRVLDRHRLSLPPDLSPGTLRLQVGLYRPDDGTRMPVFDQADRRMPDDVAILTDIALSGKSDQDEH
jgi:hypothetical protein